MLGVEVTHSISWPRRPVLSWTTFLHVKGCCLQGMVLNGFPCPGGAVEVYLALSVVRRTFPEQEVGWGEWIAVSLKLALGLRPSHGADPRHLLSAFQQDCGCRPGPLNPGSIDILGHIKLCHGRLSYAL